MDTLGITQHVVWVVALWFGAGWLFGVIAAPRMRLHTNISIVFLWCCSIISVFLGLISVFHLLWAMPLALLLNMPTFPPQSFIRLILTRGPILVVALYGAAYFSPEPEFEVSKWVTAIIVGAIFMLTLGFPAITGMFARRPPRY